MVPKIKSIKAREILDSRGNPTVEVDLMTDNGDVFRASVPSGASRGKYEAKELRDGGKRFLGKGVLRAVDNVNKIIASKLKGERVTEQQRLDNLMIELDGTKDKSRLGANAILPVSMAICRAGAAAYKQFLYQYISQLYSQGGRLGLPKPAFNIINGGVHAGNDLDFQEFMIVPQTRVYSSAIQWASEIYHTLKKILEKRFGEPATNVGDEGGFAPPIRFPEEALDLITQAVNKIGYEKKIRLILDVAASQLYQESSDSPKFSKRKESKYVMAKNQMIFTSDGLLNYYQKLIERYPIEAIEDPFAENDWEGFELITKEFGETITIIGDDLLVTNPKRIEEAHNKKACNGLLLKINQIGTISEALLAAKLARSYHWKIMVSHRSGETDDDFISDLAIGIGADFIKAGAPARGERVAKYNRLLKIEEDL